MTFKPRHINTNMLQTYTDLTNLTQTVAETNNRFILCVKSSLWGLGRPWELCTKEKATWYFWIHRQLNLLLWNSSFCFRLISFVKFNISLWVKLFLHPFHSQFLASRASSVLTPWVSVSKSGLRHGMHRKCMLVHLFSLGVPWQLHASGDCWAE